MKNNVQWVIFTQCTFLFTN